MDQADRLRSLASRVGEGETRVISITSGKGGVGKTNVAVNLALLFARKGFKTLLIDADLGLANANLIVGCRVDKTLDDVMFGQSSMQDIFVHTACGFDLLPSSSGMRKMLELDSFAQRTLFDRLFEAMQAYDVVIYDTAPGIGSHVLNFNAAAHDIVVMAHPEPTALADAYALIKVLHQERREKRFKLLINRAHSPDEGLEAFRRISDVSDEFLNISVDYLGALPEDISVLRAVRMQRPVCVDAPRSAFAMALDRVGDKLLAGGSRVFDKKLWSRGMSGLSATGSGALMPNMKEVER